MKRIVWVVFLVLGVSLAAAAQDEPTRVEVFGGYSNASIDVGAPFNHRPFNGWHAAFQGNFTGWFALVGDFSGHYKSLANVSPGLGDIKVSKHFYTFGPRLTARGKRVNGFGHVLFGGARSHFDQPGAGIFDDNAFTIVVGGGVDWNPSRRVAIRLFQLDGVLPRFGNNFDKNARVSFGVVFRLGGSI